MSCERTPDVARPWQYHMEAYNSKQAKEEQSKVFLPKQYRALRRVFDFGGQYLYTLDRESQPASSN